MTKQEHDAAVEEGWMDAIGYINHGATKYTGDLPERSGAKDVSRELAIARQRGVTGQEPDTRVEMLERFSPMEAMVISEVERLMKRGVSAHSVTRLVVQALLYGPEAALKE